MESIGCKCLQAKITFKAARLNHNLSIESAAHLIGIPPEILLDLENNPETIPVFVAKKMEQVYRISIDHVLFE